MSEEKKTGVNQDTAEAVTEKLNELVGTVESQIKVASEKGKAYTTEEINKIREEIENLTKQVGDYKEALNKHNVHMSGVNEGKDQFSLSKMVYAISRDDWTNAGYEKEVIDQTMQKAQDTNTGAAGGYLIPTNLSKEIIKPALADTVMDKLGVTKWEGLTGNVDVPERTNTPSLTWGADGVAATLQSLTYALKTLNPKTGNMLVKISNKLLMQANVANQDMIEAMRDGISDGIDKIMITGTGSSSELLGILNASGTNTTNISSARLTHDHIAAMITDVEEQNYLKKGNAGLLTRPKVVRGLTRQLVAQYSGDTSGQPIVVPLISDTKLEEHIGIKIAKTTNVTVASNLTYAVVGEWKHFLMALWSGISIKKSTEAGSSFQNNETWMVVFVNADSMVRHPLAFDIASNVSTDF